MRVFNHVGRDDSPVAPVGRPGLLAIPEACLWHIDCGVVEPTLVYEHLVETVLLGVVVHFWKSLVPIEVRISRQITARVAKTEARRQQKNHKQNGRLTSNLSENKDSG